MSGQLLARRYQIIRVLGAGAFAQTYVARDTHIPGSPTCVVKHLNPASNSPQLLETARELFRREAETLVKLGKHDRIPKLFAYFEEDQECYLAQQFIEGHTLSAELPLGQRLPESRVIQLLEEVLNILVFVHTQGVIHRDIKPDNIIRRAWDNKLVLIDYGAIKQVESQQPSLAEQEQPVAGSTRIGTPGYTPTEQDRGKPRPCSDIYALGMVGIQALTGVPPQHFEEDDETGEIIWQDQAQVSSELEAILTKMVRYHFKERYQSAEEVLEALEQLKNPSPTATVQATVVDRFTPREYTPTHKVTQQVGALAQAVAPTALQEPVIQTAEQNTTSSSFRNQTRVPVSLPTFSSISASISDSNLPRLMKIGVAALVSVGAGYTYLQWQSNNPEPTNKAIAKSDPSAPTDLSNPTDISIADSDSTDKPRPTAPSIDDSELVTFSNSRDKSIDDSDLITSSNPTDISLTNFQPVDLSKLTNTSKVNSASTVKLRPRSTSKANFYSSAKSRPKNTSKANSYSSVKPRPTVPTLDDLDPAANSEPTGISTTNFDPTANLDPTGTSTTNFDPTANLDPTGTSTTNFDLTQLPSNDGPSILARAIDKANSGDVQEAINLAGQIPSSSPAYPLAQNAIAQWQEQQQQNLGRQQAENQAGELVDNVKDVPQTGEDGDIGAAIGIAEEAIAQAPLDSAVPIEAPKAFPQWQLQAMAQQEQEAAAPSYACYCQPSDPSAQNAAPYTEPSSDVTALGCTVSGSAGAKAIGFWKCSR